MKTVNPDDLEWYDNGYRLHGELFTGIEKANDYECHYLNGKFHRDDKPAYVDVEGVEEWYQFGKLHREDGPASIDRYGVKEWWVKGECHREDGPAVVYPDGYCSWYLDGKAYRTINDWAKAIGILDTEEFTMMKLKWG